MAGKPGWEEISTSDTYDSAGVNGTRRVILAIESAGVVRAFGEEI
tara:strand:- start:457 stop:591 length:135 start_codon:yes stop_codon:yes gene_type:complete